MVSQAPPSIDPATRRRRRREAEQQIHLPTACVLRLPTSMKRRLSAPCILLRSIFPPLVTSARVKLGSKGPERRTGALRCGENLAYLYRLWESRRADSNR